MRCDTLLNQPHAELDVSTPQSHWFHGYLTGRRFAARKPGAPIDPAAFGVPAVQRVKGWDFVLASCAARADATLMEASRPWAAQLLADPPRYSENGGENEETCAHLRAVDAIAPRHFEEIFGPWLDGFLTAVHHDSPPGAADLDVAWTSIAVVCKTTPNANLLQAAAPLAEPARY